MKTMKTMKTCCALIGAASVLAAPSLFASIDGTITATLDYGGLNGGGAFTAVTSGLGTFDTFCLEKNEDLTFGYPYSYTINSGTVQGGLGVAPTGVPGFDPLSIGTAYLYSQFAAGTLAGYTYGSADSANALQQAIWWLEDEVTDQGIGAAFITAAELATSTTATTVQYDANGAFGVVALNVTDPNQRDPYRQDVLAIVPESSTVIAGALLLLPLGVSAIRIIRKNRVA